MVMAITLTLTSGEKRSFNIDSLPDVCPRCHRGVRPVKPDWNHVRVDDDLGIPELDMVFICPVASCNRLFFARYLANSLGVFNLSQCFPADLQNVEQLPEIEKISPDFCSIYDEAHAAEALELMLICGPGYRKALEFLIKDYLKSLKTTDAEITDIAKLQLGPVIAKYVTDARMKTTAERATWLGNDETHYVRKWEDKDLQDMKRYIELTCYWIQSEHLTKEAAVSMPQGKKP